MSNNSTLNADALVEDRAPIAGPRSAPLGPVSFPSLAEQPLVSVVVPSFNQGKYIRATIDSILSQDYRPIQIVVMDGGSKDETVEVLKSYGSIGELEWVSERDRGPVDAVNKGFSRVRGALVGIQSSDDLYHPGAIRRVVAEFQVRPEAGLVYGDCSAIDATGTEISRVAQPPFSLLELLRFRIWTPQPSAFFRRELLDVLGGWDDRIPFTPDTDLWIRIALRCPVVKVDQFVGAVRKHDEQRDKLGAKIVDSYKRMIAQSADIAGSSPEIRAAAAAGSCLCEMKYGPKMNSWRRARLLWQAGRHDPACRNLNRVARLVAVEPVINLLRRLKRAVVPRRNRSG
jgi:glycosyltransferase involved in cell wall biosynthesis